METNFFVVCNVFIFKLAFLSVYPGTHSYTRTHNVGQNSVFPAFADSLLLAAKENPQKAAEENPDRSRPSLPLGDVFREHVSDFAAVKLSPETVSTAPSP